ncbi:MAG: FkbM family methyltransferase [Deltaproteobacteria bacterium]|nr:FkbM family methyltransferase [Deltaproteobacteria bacterium]MBW2132000.1 FkbM family methyltransferase [Deltaproteobacteria bacterium]
MMHETPPAQFGQHLVAAKSQAMDGFMQNKSLPAVFEHLTRRLAGNAWVHNGVAAVNRIPFPFLQRPVSRGNQRLAAHTFDRYIALWLWKLGLLESLELQLLAEICKPGMVAVDIGANVGYHALWIAQHVGIDGAVWAFEPEPGNYKALMRNIRLNHLSNIFPVQKAIGAKSGSNWLYVSKSHNGNHSICQPLFNNRHLIPIDMATLDDFFPPSQRIDLIKMDIEGAEGLALAGMQRCLAENPELTVFFEFSPSNLSRTGFAPAAVLAGLKDVGFHLALIDEDRKRLTTIEDVSSFAASTPHSSHVNLLATKAALPAQLT